jgi:hypothetical protein
MHILGDGKTCSFDSTPYRINIITEDQPGGNPEIAETKKFAATVYCDECSYLEEDVARCPDLAEYVEREREMKGPNGLRKHYTPKDYDPFTGHLGKLCVREHVWTGKEEDLKCGMLHWGAVQSGPVRTSTGMTSPLKREWTCGGRYGEQTKQ